MSGLKPVGLRRSDALARVDWRQLEALLVQHYRSQGWQVKHCGTGGSGARFDGGVDLRLRREGECVLVQAKHWNAFQVPHNAVHELLGVMVNEAATGAILVTSGEFTPAAIEAANRQGHVQLVDGEELRAMLGPAAIEGLDADESRADAFVRSMSAPLQPRSSTSARPRPRAVRPSPWPWLVAAAVGLLVFVMLIRGVLEKSRWTAGPSEPPSAAAQGPAIDDVAPDREQPARPAAVEADACIHVVDGVNGAYVDGCAQRAAPGPTAAELREQARRADAAIKVIEASTPEM